MLSRCLDSLRLLALGEEELGVTCSVGACEKGMGDRERDVDRDDASERAGCGLLRVLPLLLVGMYMCRDNRLDAFDCCCWDGVGSGAVAGGSIEPPC